MQTKHIDILVFCIILFLSSSILISGLFNPFQIPRLSILFVGIFTLIGYRYYRTKQAKIHLTLPDVFFILYIIWNAILSHKALSLGDSTIMLIQYCTLFAVYKLAEKLYSTHSKIFISVLCKTILIVQLVIATTLYFGIYLLPTCAVFEDLYSIRGLMGHKNISVSYLLISTPILIYLYTHSSKIWKYLAAISIICSVSLLIIIESRSSLITAMAAAAVCIIVWYRTLHKEYNQIIRIATIIILGIALGFGIRYMMFCGEMFPKHDGVVNPLTDNYYYDRGNEHRTLMTSSSLERVELWKKTIRMIQDNPISGVGLQQWKFHINAYGLEGLIRSEISDIVFTSPHNDYLVILAESGIVGFILYAAFVIGLCFFYISHRKLYSAFEHHMFFVILLFAGIAFFEFPHTILPLGILCFLSFATLSTHIKPLVSIVNNFIIICIFIFFVFSIFVLYNNYLGNYYSSKIIQNKHKKDMLSYCTQASSIWYTSDNYGMPIDWYKGTYFAENNQYDSAFTAFSKAYKIAPYNRYINLDLATLHAIQQDTAEARMRFEKTLRISPHYDKARINYAIFLIQEKQEKKAYDIIQYVYDTSNIQYKNIKTYLQTNP